jgi:hypothetical protein
MNFPSSVSWGLYVDTNFPRRANLGRFFAIGAPGMLMLNTFITVVLSANPEPLCQPDSSVDGEEKDCPGNQRQADYR